MTTRPKAFDFEEAWDLILSYTKGGSLAVLMDHYEEMGIGAATLSDRLRVVQAAFQPLLEKYDGVLRKDDDRFLAMAAWEAYHADPEGYEQATDRPLTPEEEAGA